jgi:hypothetical protein
VASLTGNRWLVHARSRIAVSLRDGEKGTVTGKLDMDYTRIQEPLGQPVEWEAPVRAAIQIAAVHAVPVHDEKPWRAARLYAIMSAGFGAGEGGQGTVRTQAP